MNTSILTIDPGARSWGVSIFHGRQIIACMIKNLSAKDSPGNRLSQVRAVFLSLCREYNPTVLVIENPCEFLKYQSDHLASVILEIRRLAKRKHIKVIEYSPEAVRKFLCKDEHATMRNIADVVSQSYPDLKDYLAEVWKCKDKYWGRMVGSVGLGICYLIRQKLINF